jgi:small-conductance mechanosensitive channel
MHEKQVARAYRKELWSSVAVYMVLLFGSITYARQLPDSVLRTVLLVSPMIGFALMIRSIARHVARIDEYQRMRLLENLALSAAITGAATFTYGFLETAGFPRLSMFTVWVVMGSAWLLVSVIRRWTER